MHFPNSPFIKSITNRYSESQGANYETKQQRKLQFLKPACMVRSA